MIRELTRADELTVPPQRDIQYWSENYCFDAYDPKSNAGLWMHLGRWSKSPDLWREQTKLYLPDGSVLLWKTLGGRGEDAGPTSATLSFRCVQPGTWELTFDGPARRVASERLLDGALPDGPLTHVRAKFRYVSGQPVWDLGDDAENQIWCSAHYEQPGRVSGVIEYGDERIELNGASAYRDHSRGPRYMKDLRRHAWVHAQTEANMGFGMFYMEVAGQEGLARAFFVDSSGELSEAEVVDPPYADSVAELTGHYSFGLRLKSGHLVTIDATPVLTVTSSFVVPYEKLHGVSAEASHISCHQCTTFLIDGIPAAGMTERSFVA